MKNKTLNLVKSESGAEVQARKRNEFFKRYEALVKAFEYEQAESGIDDAKALLSISFLLDWCSDMGNREVDGYIATGLARIAHTCAKRHVGMSLQLQKLQDAFDAQQ